MKKTSYIIRLFAVISLGALGLPALSETRQIEVPLLKPPGLLERPIDEISAYVDYRIGMRKCELFAATANPFIADRPVSFSERDPDLGNNFDLGDNIVIDAEYEFVSGQDNIIASFGFVSLNNLHSTCFGSLKMSRDMEGEIWEWATEALRQLSTASYATSGSLEIYSNDAFLRLCELVPYADVFKETQIHMLRFGGAGGQYGVVFGVVMWQRPEHPLCDTGVIR